MFAEEKPFLLPLPIEPFRYYQYGERTVHLDGCVEVEAAYYGAPPGWIGRRVQGAVGRCARALARSAHRSAAARASAPATRPASHPRRGSLRANTADTTQLPSREPTTPARTSARSAKPSISDEGELGVRRILGVLSLAKKYGVAAVEMPAPPRWKSGVAEYRFVRRYLERSPPAPLTLRQVDPLIRELTQYRDLINTNQPRRTSHESD